MTLRDQANFILTALNDWAAPASGRVFMASDVIDCIEQLRLKPGVPAIALLWIDETPRGENEFAGRVDRTWKVILSRARGLKLQSGESLTEGASGGGPLFDLVEQVREVLLALRLPAPEDGLTYEVAGEDTVPAYKGASPFEVQGLILDAIEIKFTLAAQITVQLPL